MTIKGLPWWASGPSASAASGTGLISGQGTKILQSHGATTTTKKSDSNSLIGRGWDIALGDGIRGRHFFPFFDFWYFLFIFLENNLQL